MMLKIWMLLDKDVADGRSTTMAGGLFSPKTEERRCLKRNYRPIGIDSSVQLQLLKRARKRTPPDRSLVTSTPGAVLQESLQIEGRVASPLYQARTFVPLASAPHTAAGPVLSNSFDKTGLDVGAGYQKRERLVKVGENTDSRRSFPDVLFLTCCFNAQSCPLFNAEENKDEVCTNFIDRAGQDVSEIELDDWS
ncbi:unnamed protein product [Caenorhabditis auriculariae]|uniref:Uncharacterized protein n=1 Tax=Caenorhabditis auriculariae TaxID=2777116 RepID=A0A8S1HE60_9PELO|nr:unnamed protein product [Caenorhabditis auriculariae]